MNISSSAVVAWGESNSSVGVGFVRLIGVIPKVSFWILPARLSPIAGKSLRFTWDSGELSVDVEGAEVDEVTAHEIPLSLFSKGVPKIEGAVRFSISTAERLFVFKLAS
jgi:hypothetical protein